MEKEEERMIYPLFRLLIYSFFNKISIFKKVALNLFLPGQLRRLV